MENGPPQVRVVGVADYCRALALAIHGMSELGMREKPHAFQWDVLLATVTPAADPIPASVVEKQALFIGRIAANLLRHASKPLQGPGSRELSTERPSFAQAIPWHAKSCSQHG